MIKPILDLVEGLTIRPGDTLFYDFWEFDPNNGSDPDEMWQKMANLPLKKNSSEPEENGGRDDAIAFALTGSSPSAFVGGGRNGLVLLQDFWEFDPETGDVGEWTLHSFFPGKERYNAVGFSIGARAFMGTGTVLISNDLNFYLNDFWEFNPNRAEGAWIPRTSFQGAPRDGAIGFSIQEEGYLGTGRGAGVPTNTRFNDFWIYYPEEL